MMLAPDEKQNGITKIKSAKRKKQKLKEFAIEESAAFSAGDLHELNTVQNEDGEFGNSKKSKKKKRKYLEDKTNEEDQLITHSETSHKLEEAKQKSKKKKKRKKDNDSYDEATYIDTFQDESEVKTKSKKKKKHKEHINEENPLQINAITTTSDDVRIKKKKKRKTEDELDFNGVDVTNRKTICENDVGGPNSNELEELMATVLKQWSPKLTQDSVAFSEEKSNNEIVEHNLKNLKDKTSNNWGFSESITAPRGTFKHKGRNEGKPTGEKCVRQQSILTEKLFKDNKINSKKVKSHTDIWKDDVPLEEVLCRAQEAKDLTEEQVQKLKSLKVTIPGPIHPLHTIETRIISAPTPEQKEQISSLGIDIKTTMFTKEEDARIKANWVEFCKTHDWGDDPAAFLSTKYLRRIPTQERIDFARFIAYGLNNRLLRSVFGRFQKLVNHQRVTGRFSEDEDKIIVEYMKTTKSNNPFADLAKILNRSNISLIKRYKTLVESTDETVKWTDDKIKTFLDYLLQVTKSENVEELKDKEISNKHWRKISRRMDIPEEKLRRAWLYRIKHRVFIDYTIGTDTIKISLINLLYESNEYDWRNINWDKYAENFEGISGARINKFFKDLVRYYCPEAIKNDLRECVTFLNNVVLKKVTFQSKKFRKIEL